VPVPKHIFWNDYFHTKLTPSVLHSLLHAYCTELVCLYISQPKNQGDVSVIKYEVSYTSLASTCFVCNATRVIKSAARITRFLTESR